jgi:hypothetical protein
LWFWVAARRAVDPVRSNAAALSQQSIIPSRFPVTTIEKHLGLEKKIAA